MKNEEKIRCILDGNRGIYIPQAFARQFDLKKWHVATMKDSIIDLESGPDAEFYWESWETILDSAYMKEGKHTWTLYMDGDLFAVRDDYKFDE